MNFDKDFKIAISELPSSEKTKLILRLLKKNIPLAKKLHFELLSTDSVDKKRELMEQKVKDEVAHFTKHFHSIGYLLMDMRMLSGLITDHVKTTKDKIGDPSLNILMLIEVLNINNENILDDSYGRSYTTCIYIIARAFKILLQIKSLHEDYLIEFESSITKLGKLISQNDYLMRTAINNGLDVNWLLRCDIPIDIKEIHKEIRENGYLR